MTKISIYNVDGNVAGNDRWIGTDAQNFNATKNFTPNGLADYFNHNQVIDSGNALRYTYQTLDPLEARRFGTISFITEIGPQVPFEDISTFLLSKYTLKYNIVSEYLQFLNGAKVVISKASDTNFFGLYKITNVNVYLPEPNFFNVDLSFIDGNGSMNEDQDYIISLVLDKYDQPVTNTSQLINDGADGVHPFITAQDIPPSASTLQEVTDNGNTTTNDIILNNIPGEYGDYSVTNAIQDLGIFQEFSSPTNENYTSYYAGYGMGLSGSINTTSKIVTIQESSVYLQSYDSSDNNYNGFVYLEGTDNNGSSYIALGNKLNNEGKFKVTNLTNDGVVLQFPNKATGEYTIATTADIPVYTTPTLQSVTTAGSTTTNPITIYDGLKNSYLYQLGLNLSRTETGIANTLNVNTINGITMDFNVTGTGHFINSIQIGGFVSQNMDNGDIGSLTAGGGLTIKTISSLFSPGTANLKADLLTGNRTYQFPDSAGTLALTSQIPTVGTWGALNYPTWTSGTPFVKMTAAGTFALDTNTYLTGITSSDVTTALGYTPVTNARTLTINGTTYDLTANRSWTIPTYTSPLTTKGDIFVRNSSSDTRLPIGLDTQVLIADSTQATGMKWGSNTAATPTGYYGAWQDNITQTAASSNVGYPMIFRTTDLSNGVTVVSNGTNLTRITFANTGIYNLQFSSQFQNSGNSQEDVTVWLRLNGVDVPGSSGFVSVPARKAAGAGNEGHVVSGWNYVLNVVGGQYYELVWSTSNSTNVTMQYYAAGSPPPSAASVIMTVTQQSGIMAGTGLTAINSLTGAVQTLATGTTGTDFGISSTGTTHTFNIPTASSTNRGLLSSTDWTTFNSKGNGTVTSVAALTLGTTGTDLSSTVATGTTTPVITLNVPTASATNRGALSSTDWTTFNSKIGGSGTTNYLPKFTGTSALGNSMIFDNGTSVGINNGAPNAGYKLDVIGTTRFSSGTFVIEANNFPTFKLNDTSGANRAWLFTASKTNFGDFEIANTGGTTGFAMNQSNNNIGIGTTYSNTSKLLITDTTLAGSGALAGSALTINQTWNTTGLPTSILLNVTKTAVANYSAKLIDLQVGGGSKFNVDSNGNTTAAGAFTGGQSSLSNLNLTNVNVAGYGLSMAHTLNATSGTVNIIKLTPTYNQVASTAANTDIFLNRTETSVGSGAQLLMDLQVGGVSKFSVDNKGLVTSLTITNRQTASYTLALTDNGKLVETNVATANNVTIPLNSSVAFPIGTKIDVVQYGAGQTTFVATSGVTIRSANNWLKMNAQYGAATLTKIGTDEWYLWGNLNA